MSTAIAEKKLSTRPVELGAHQRARQSQPHPDCRSTTIKLTVTQISLALSSRRDNHHPAATAEMAILIVAVFRSRLSRYIDPPHHGQIVGTGERPGTIDTRTRQIQQRTLSANRQCLARPLDHRPALGDTHRPGLLAKKSLSTVNWPILV